MTHPVPDHIVDRLLGTYAYEAGKTIVSDRGASVPHPGDDYGLVLWWLWSDGREFDAVRFVADLLAAVHSQQADRGIAPVEFERLLTGIRYSLPGEADEAETQRLLDHLRAKAPTLYDSPRYNSTHCA